MLPNFKAALKVIDRHRLHDGDRHCKCGSFALHRTCPRRHTLSVIWIAAELRFDITPIHFVELLLVCEFPQGRLFISWRQQRTQRVSATPNNRKEIFKGFALHMRCPICHHRLGRIIPLLIAYGKLKRRPLAWCRGRAMGRGKVRLTPDHTTYETKTSRTY